MNLSSSCLCFGLCVGSLAACSKAIARPEDDVDPTGAPDAQMAPLVVESVVAATTPRALFAMSLTTSSPVADVIRTDELPVDIVAQRLITRTDQALRVSVELTPPTGVYSRTVVRDYTLEYTVDGEVPCKYNGVVIAGPPCPDWNPVFIETPSAGPIRSARWTLAMIDEMTSTPIETCIELEHRIDCVLPARASAYRIVVSANGFEDLWNGTAGVGEQLHHGAQFTGTVATGPDKRCTYWKFVGELGEYGYCMRYDVFLGFQALDRARLDFDPISLTVTTDGVSIRSQSSALSWDGGDDDLPDAP